MRGWCIPFLPFNLFLLLLSGGNSRAFRSPLEVNAIKSLPPMGRLSWKTAFSVLKKKYDSFPSDNPERSLTEPQAVQKHTSILSQGVTETRPCPI